MIWSASSGCTSKDYPKASTSRPVTTCRDLIAQGPTINETVEIARDVARRLIQAQQKRDGGPELPEPGEQFDYPMLVAV